jgi:hypothetical protein
MATRALSERGPFSSNPLLNGRPFPLRPRIADQVNRNFVANQYQPIEHECEIDIGDRPVVEQVFAAMAEHSPVAAQSFRDESCAAEESGAEIGRR